MFLVLDGRKLIIEIAPSAIIQEDDSIKIGEHLLINQEGLELVEVESIPLEIIPIKYFYIDSEYILNPSWVNSNENEEYEQRISTLQEANATLEDVVNTQDEKISSLQDMVIMIANDEI